MTRSCRGAEGPGWRLYVGDCLPVLCQLPEGCLDAVVTDPPYCSGGIHPVARRRLPGDKYRLDQHPSFAGDQRDQRGFTAWATMWLAECYRAMRERSPLFVFIDWRQLPALTDAVQAAGFVWRGVIVWDKGLGCRPQPNWLRNQHEFILAATRGGLPDRDPPVYLPGVIHAANPRQRTHMTEKPAAVLDALMPLIAPGGLVADPFAGSGSTGAAALRSGRRFVGCEWEPVYQAEVMRRMDRFADSRPCGKEPRE